MDVAQAPAEKETVQKEDFAEETNTDMESGETKEVDVKATKDSAKEIDTNDGSGKTREVDLTAEAKETEEVVLKEDYCRGNRHR